MSSVKFQNVIDIHVRIKIGFILDTIHVRANDANQRIVNLRNVTFI